MAKATRDRGTRRKDPGRGPRVLSGELGTAPSRAASWLFVAISVLRNLACVRFLLSAQASRFKNSRKKSTSISAPQSFLKPAGSRGSLKAFFFFLPLHVLESGSGSPSERSQELASRGKSDEANLPEVAVAETARKGRELESSGESASGEKDWSREVLPSILLQPGFAFCLR